MNAEHLPYSRVFSQNHAMGTFEKEFVWTYSLAARTGAAAAPRKTDGLPNLVAVLVK